MAYNFVQTILPCLGRKGREVTESRIEIIPQSKEITSTTSSPKAPSWSSPRVQQTQQPKPEVGIRTVEREITERLPTIKPALSVASTKSMSARIVAVSELSAHPSPIEPSHARSMSTSAIIMQGGGKRTTGKRRRVQTMTIDAPVPGLEDSEPTRHSPLTYPSPSRVRPENMFAASQEMDFETETIRADSPLSSASTITEPSPALTTSSTIFSPMHGPDRPLPLRFAPFKLGPIAPIAPINLHLPSDEFDGADLKRKPVPIRVRSSSDPTTPTFLPPDFGIPSPVELEASHAQPIELGLKTPRPSSFDSAADLPSPPLQMSSRLSAGALGLLSSFPIIPASPTLPRSLTIEKVQSTLAASRIKSVALLSREQSSPKSRNGKSPRMGNGAPLWHSPSQISPRTRIPFASLDEAAQSDSPSAAQKSLPPTPRSGKFVRERFISIASGFEWQVDETTPVPAWPLASPLSEKNWTDNDTESIQIFFAASVPGSPDPRYQ